MNETKVDYLNGKLFPMILKFSIPAAVSLLITAVYNIVDRMFVGNFNGTSALAGLSVCFPLSYMMMAFALMCSAGGSWRKWQLCGNKANAGGKTGYHSWRWDFSLDTDTQSGLCQGLCGANGKYPCHWRSYSDYLR